MSQGNKGPPEQKGYLIFVIVRKIIVYLFCAAIIIAALLFASSKTPNKTLFGYRYYTVITPSMTPAYCVGDMVLVKVVPADQIEVGDVITFNPSSDSNAYLTHRVTQKLPDYQNTGVTCFRTKGDANDTEDSFRVDESRVIGKVTLRVPKLGYVIRFVQLRWYYILPLAVMLWLSLHLMKQYFKPQQEETPDQPDAPADDSAAVASPSEESAPKDQKRSLTYEEHEEQQKE